MKNINLVQITLILLLACFIDQVLSQNITTAESATTANQTSCKFAPTSIKTKPKFTTLTSASSTWVINIKFILSEITGNPLEGAEKTNIFLPLEWEWCKGIHGQRLLFLKRELRSLPFSSLQYGVHDFVANVTASPTNCVTNSSMNISTLVLKLRNLILSDFGDAVIVDRDSSQKICHQFIRSKKGVAEFYYLCCYQNEDQLTECREIEKDFWINMLLGVTITINVFVVLYSPFLIPKQWYREKYMQLKYTLNLEKPLLLKLMKTTDCPQDTRDSGGPQQIFESDLQKQADLDKFKAMVSLMKKERPYQITMSKIHIKIKADDLIPPNYAPVGIMRTLYDSVIKCGVRESYAVKDCCYSNVFGKCQPFRKPVIWYKCLQKVAFLLRLFLFSIPWIIRLYIYYIYEDKTRIEHVAAATSRNLLVDYPGNLLAYFTPVHGLFLFCYLILFMDVLLYRVLQQRITERSRFIIRKCFRDMREMNRSQVIGYCLHVLLLPIQKFGIFFLPLAWIYWALALPLFIMLILFYFMPLTNIICRLIIHFLSAICQVNKIFNPIVNTFNNLYKKLDYTIEFSVLDQVKEVIADPQKPKTAKEKAINMAVTFILIISIISFTVLALEFLIVASEYMIYQIIGLVLNWSVHLKIVTLVFMLILYAADSFGSVSNRYLVFNEKLVAALKSKSEEQMKKILLLPPEIQGNTAFRVPAHPHVENNDQPATKNDKISLKVKEHKLQWLLPRVVLFLDKYDISYVTNKFFFASLNMKNAGCPGSLSKSLFSAFSNFMMIVAFLFFVFLVTSAFGEHYDVSGVNQTLLAVAGGVLPWFFKNILKKPLPDFDLDTNSIYFQSAFNDLISTFSQNWEVYDIECLENHIQETTDTTIHSDVDLLINKCTNNNPTDRPQVHQADHSINYQPAIPRMADQPIKAIFLVNSVEPV